MKTPTSILVILDKPKHPQVALDKAIELQRASGAHLQIVSFAWHAMAEHKEVFDVHQRRALKKEILRARGVWVDELVRDRRLNAANLTARTIWAPDIADWIEEYAADMDLVIKSVHRSKTLLHTPLDWQLIRSCPKPLLLVGSETRKRRKPKGEQDVLATLDLRNSDRKHQLLNLKVLDAAARFADLHGGKLHCVAVVEYSEVLQDLDLLNVRKVQKQTIAATEDFLKSLIAPYDIPASRVHRPAGKVGHLVSATARKTGAGLIVVGTAARRSVGARVLGGSAEKILSKAPCDVLTIHL